MVDSVLCVANFQTLKTTDINTKTELVCNTRSKLQIEEEREYERVLYDNLTFRQMMANAREAKIKQLQEVEAKEKEFETKLVKKTCLDFIVREGYPIKREALIVKYSQT